MVGPVLTALAAKALTEHVVVPAVKAGAKAVSQVVNAGVQQFRKTGTTARSTFLLNAAYDMGRSKVSRNDVGGHKAIFGNCLSNDDVAKPTLSLRKDPRLTFEPTPTPALSLRNDPPLRARPG